MVRGEFGPLCEKPLVRAVPDFGGWYVPVDIYQTAKDVVVLASLPGMKTEEVDISIIESTLTIKGEYKPGHDLEEADYVFRERYSGTFSRSVVIPVPVDSEKAEVVFENGVLTVRLPKAEEFKPRQVNLKAGYEAHRGTKASPEIQKLKQEHEVIRAYIKRVEDCIRDAHSFFPTATEGELKLMKNNLFTLYYTLCSLKDGEQEHAEKEEDLLLRHMAGDLGRVLEQQHREIKQEIGHATEVIAEALPKEPSRDQLTESCSLVGRILRPLFGMWQKHLSVVDMIIDSLPVDIAEKKEKPATQPLIDLPVGFH